MGLIAFIGSFCMGLIYIIGLFWLISLITRTPEEKAIDADEKAIEAKETAEWKRFCQVQKKLKRINKQKERQSPLQKALLRASKKK